VKASSIIGRLALTVFLVVVAFSASYLDTYFLFDNCYREYYQTGESNGYCVFGFYIVRPLQFIILHPILILGFILSPLKVNPFIFLLLTPVILIMYWFFMIGLITRCVGRICPHRHPKRK
jgi:hypothetical protein